MSGFIKKSALFLAGVAMLASCRKDNTAPKPQSVSQGNTYAWTVYGMQFNASKAEILTFPLQEDNEYYAETTHDVQLIPLTGIPDVNGAYDVEITPTAKPSRSSLETNQIYDLNWQSDLNFPQNPNDLNSLNVTLRYSRHDKTPILKWKDENSQDQSADFLDIKAQVVMEIITDEKDYPGSENIAKTLENGQSITMHANLTPGTVIYSKKDHIRAAYIQ